MRASVPETHNSIVNTLEISCSRGTPIREASDQKYWNLIADVNFDGV